MLSEAFILKNRMREICSYGSVGGLGREAQVYPGNRAWLDREKWLEDGMAGIFPQLLSQADTERQTFCRDRTVTPGHQRSAD